MPQLSSGTQVDANHEVVDSSGQAVKVDQVEDLKPLWDMPAMAPAKLAKLQSRAVRCSTSWTTRARRAQPS